MLAREVRDAPKPRLRRGLAVVPTARGIVIDGGRRRYLLGGASGQPSKLPMLLSLLTGEHDVETLSRKCDMPVATLTAMLASLRSRGLLELAPVHSCPVQAGEHVREFLSRMASGQPAGPDPEQILQTLAAATVIVAAPPEFGRLVAADLRETGIGRIVYVSDITSLRVAGLDLADPARASRSLVVACESHERVWPARTAVADTVAAFSSTGVPVLRCSVDGGVVELGPLFHEAYSACVDCFYRGYQEMELGHRSGGAAQDEADQCSDPAALNVLCGITVSETLALLAGVRPPDSVRTVSRLTLDGYTLDRYCVTPYAECSRCGWPGLSAPGQDQGGEGALAPLEYEWLSQASPYQAGNGSPATSIALGDSGLGDPVVGNPVLGNPVLGNAALSDDPMHAAQPDTSPYQEFLPYVDLRDAMDVPGPTPPEDARLAVLLGRLITAAADVPAQEDGGDPRSALRTATDIYIVTGEELFGLPGSIFRYDPTCQRLSAVNTSATSVREFLAGTDLDPQGLRAVLVLVSRTQGLKIADRHRCRRAGLLDAGRCAARFAAVAGPLGLQACFAAHWGPHLADVLELMPGYEVITAVAGLAPRDGDVACR
jgi:hypothetical protein